MKVTGQENTGYILKELGARLRDIRIAFPMTREELSERSGVSLSTITRAESGDNIGVESLINILRVLHRLNSIDLVLPEYVQSPMDMVNGKNRRKRASSKKDLPKRLWKRGDEK